MIEVITKNTWLVAVVGLIVLVGIISGVSKTGMFESNDTSKGSNIEKCIGNIIDCKQTSVTIGGTKIGE